MEVVVYLATSVEQIGDFAILIQSKIFVETSGPSLIR